MTDPAPDPAAVQIVARAVTLALATSDTPYEDVVAALARAYDLCPPGTLARVAALEAAQRYADALSFPNGEAESYFVAGYSRGWEAAALDVAVTTAEGESGARS